MAMAIAIAPTSKPLPPVRAGAAAAAAANSVYDASSSYCLRFSSVSNIDKIRLRYRREQPPPIKCGSSGTVLETDEAQFSDVVLKSESPVLVEFVATWCGPCRLIAPAVQALAQEYEGKLRIVKVDHDANPRLIEEYKVYGLPALIMFQNGKEIPGSRREGAITKIKLKEYIDKLLDSVSVV